MNNRSNPEPPRRMRVRMGAGGMGRIYGSREKPKNAKETLGRLSYYLGRNKYLLFTLLIVMAITTLLGLLTPILQGNAIDAMVVRDELHISIKDGTWSINDNSYLQATPTPLNSADTVTISISSDSTWVISGTDTLIKATYNDENNEKSYGELSINPDGYILIDGVLTNYQLNVASNAIIPNSITISLHSAGFWLVNGNVSLLHAIGVDDPNLLFNIVIILMVVFILNVFMNFLRGWISAYLSQRTVKKMRKDMFERMIYLPVSYFDTHYHGDLMSRMTNDVERISQTISQALASIFAGVLTIIGAFIIMMIYSVRLTLFSFLAIILTIVVTRIMSKYLSELFRKNQRILGTLNGQVEESITGHRTVTAFNKNKDMQKEFNEISGNLRISYIKAQTLGFSMRPIMRIINNLTFLLIVGFGSYFVYHGIDGLTIGTIIIFTSASKQFSQPINEIATLYVQIQTSIAAAERVFEVIDATPEVNDGKEDIPERVGNIEFKHVHFSYKEDEPVIKDFNLKVSPGQKIALVGATGSGKTTIVNLLMRFYDIDKGSITINGIDIRNLDKNDLRKSIAIVLQDTILFSSTIEKNIRYGNLNATSMEIEEAATMSNANTFIERLPEGYQTHLTESGNNVSQGEQQLLAIARAVLANPKILILDEATSSVDTRTEKNIQDAMVALMKNRTSLIIAHRLSTIRDADEIVVIDKGRVVETGKHEELLSQKGIYYQLYLQQFAGKAI